VRTLVACGFLDAQGCNGKAGVSTASIRLFRSRFVTRRL